MIIIKLKKPHTAKHINKNPQSIQCSGDTNLILPERNIYRGEKGE